MHLGKSLLQPTHQVEKIFQRQIRVQPADDMKLRHRLRVARGRRLPSLFQRHGVACLVALLAPKGAQPAVRHANIRRVDVPVDVEVGHIPVHPLAHMVSQPAHSQHVRGTIKRNPVVELQPLASQNFAGNRLKPRIVGAKICWLAANHPLHLHILMIQKQVLCLKLIPIQVVVQYPVRR